MKDLDFYTNTDDGNFNECAYGLFLMFPEHQTKHELRDEFSFEIFIEAIHDVYFFIIKNPNKPFAIENKIHEISKKHALTLNEQAFLLDELLAFLKDSNEFENAGMSVFHLIILRDELKPFNIDINFDDPFNSEFLINDSFFGKYHFNKIMQQVQSLKDVEDKIKVLSDIVFDVNDKMWMMNKGEKKYIVETNLIERCQNEIRRIEFNQQLYNSSKANAAKPLLEYSNNQITLIFYYFFKLIGFEPRVGVDIAPVAKFIHLITGKEFTAIVNSDFYKRLQKGPNHKKDKELKTDLEAIKPLFEKVQLNQVVKMIDNELDIIHNEFRRSNL